MLVKKTKGSQIGKTLEIFQNYKSWKKINAYTRLKTFLRRGKPSPKNYTFIFGMEW